MNFQIQVSLFFLVLLILHSIPVHVAKYIKKATNSLAYASAFNIIQLFISLDLQVLPAI